MKLLSILLSALVLVACGGGDEVPVAIIKTSVPHPVANAATVTGGSAVAVHMYQALYGMAPSNATLIAHTVQATADPSAFARTLASNFASTSSTALAKLILDNLGVTAATVTAVNAQGQSEYAILLDALGQMFTFYGADARGQIILNATNLLAGLETDTTYGMTAVSYNNQATANYSYSSNSANTGAAVISTATANAGTPQSVAVGAVVTLDGSASKADVGRTLTYAWTLTSRPVGSSAVLSSATVAKPTFTADVAGTYVASLTVNDGSSSSVAANINISAAVDNQYGTMTDTNTGLTWMRCSMGQTWSGATCTGMASTYTFNQANALTGTVTFSGRSDWRVPNIRELLTIVDWLAYSPAIDRITFPNVPLSSFWSATPNGIQNAAFIDLAWSVYFGNGNAYADTNKQDANYVRLVRGAEASALLRISPQSTDYVNHSNGTVTHTPTGLMWQICPVGQIWTGSNCSGTAGAMTLDAAKLLTSNMAGFTDWRLPKVDELITLKDFGTNYPTINNNVFPGMQWWDFWSGSLTANPDHNFAGFAWRVNFGGGDGVWGANNKIASYVRLVRAASH